MSLSMVEGVFSALLNLRVVRALLYVDVRHTVYSYRGTVPLWVENATVGQTRFFQSLLSPNPPKDTEGHRWTA